MAIIKAFRAIRPAKEYTERVAALPTAAKALSQTYLPTITEFAVPYFLEALAQQTPQFISKDHPGSYPLQRKVLEVSTLSNASVF